MAEGVFFRVDGADIQTGDETFLVLRAASSEEAEDLARKQGLLIASVRPATPEDWAARSGMPETDIDLAPIALVDKEPARPLHVQDPHTQIPAERPSEPVGSVTHFPGTTHNGLSVFANGQALAAGVAADDAIVRPSMGTAPVGSIMRTVAPSTPPIQPAETADDSVVRPAVGIAPVLNVMRTVAPSMPTIKPAPPPPPIAPPATAPRSIASPPPLPQPPPRPLAEVRPPTPPRRPPAVSPVIASPKPHGIVAHNRARLANPPEPIRRAQTVPSPIISSPPLSTPAAVAPRHPPIPVRPPDLVSPPVSVPQEEVRPPEPPVPIPAESPPELQLEMPVVEVPADLVDLSRLPQEQTPPPKVWEHASSLVAGAVVLNRPTVQERPAPVPAPLAPVVAPQARLPQAAAASVPAPLAAEPRAASASGWIVTVVLCPLALLTVIAGIAMPVYYVLNHPDPAGATDLQKIDLHLQALDQYFLGGAVVLAGLMLFVTAGLVYLGGAMKASRTR